MMLHKLKHAKYILPIVLAFRSALAFAEATADHLQIIVDVIPPYTNVVGAQLGTSKGVVIEVVEAAMKKAGLKLEVESHQYPWRRAQSVAADVPGSLIFPFARTVLREPNWKWIEIVLDEGLYVYNMPGRPPITSLDALKALPSIGVLAGGAPESKAKELGLTYQEVLNEESNFKKLFSGRLDAILSQSYMATGGMIKLLEHAPEDEKSKWQDSVKKVQRGPRVIELPLWVATSRKTPDETVAKLRSALADFKKTEEYQAILKKYAGAM